MSAVLVNVDAKVGVLRVEYCHPIWGRRSITKHDFPRKSPPHERNTARGNARANHEVIVMILHEHPFSSVP